MVGRGVGGGGGCLALGSCSGSVTDEVITKIGRKARAGAAARTWASQCCMRGVCGKSASRIQPCERNTSRSCRGRSFELLTGPRSFELGRTQRTQLKGRNSKVATQRQCCACGRTTFRAAPPRRGAGRGARGAGRAWRWMSGEWVPMCSA